MSFTNEQENLACRLFESGAIRVDIDQGFPLKEHESNPGAPRSPIYFNLRMEGHKDGVLVRNDVLQIGRRIFESAAERSRLDPTLPIVCGIPSAGDAIAEAIRVAAAVTWDDKSRNFPLLQLRKEEADGRRRIVSLANVKGYFQGDHRNRVALVDDVVSHGNSKIEAFHVLQKQGFTVTDLFVLIDRGQGGADTMREMGVEVTSVFSAKELINFYKERELISTAEHRTIQEYLAA